MTKRQVKSGTIDVKALLVEDDEFLRALVRTALQEVLEAEVYVQGVSSRKSRRSPRSCAATASQPARSVR